MPEVEDPEHDLRVTIGGAQCSQPYSSSVLNISAMSFGALGGAAVESMNTGAKAGNFAHDTGEGGISRYHRKGGGDLIWQIGTGYFGCRAKDGSFDPDLFAKNSADPQVKMIEIKVSQGAKPGHGGILPGAKVTEEIAEARLVEVGKTVFSPTYHHAFSTPLEMMAFITQLRELSGGKPVGFKICIGDPREFMAIVKAMLETDVYPDFIVVDGGEGGTGAAPLEFSDSMGAPLVEGLMIVQNVLVGAGIRDKMKLGASGKLVSAAAMAKAMALGADWCNSARGFMFAVGCIQSQRCHTNKCPVGVTTQDPKLQRAIVVPDKADSCAPVPPEHRRGPRRDDRCDGSHPSFPAAPRHGREARVGLPGDDVRGDLPHALPRATARRSCPRALPEVVGARQRRAIHACLRGRSPGPGEFSVHIHFRH